MKVGYTIGGFNNKYSKLIENENSLIDYMIRWGSTIYLNENELLKQINVILSTIHNDNDNNMELIKEEWDTIRIKNIDKVDYIIYDKEFNQFAYWVEKCNIKE